uniref:Uncharacterized protein n=1 Tax=Schistosoma haematobium TaxID=6185 RepID=A0A094ZKU8_SCHHA
MYYYVNANVRSMKHLIIENCFKSQTNKETLEDSIDNEKTGTSRSTHDIPEKPEYHEYIHVISSTSTKLYDTLGNSFAEKE